MKGEARQETFVWADGLGPSPSENLQVEESRWLFHSCDSGSYIEKRSKRSCGQKNELMNPYHILPFR